MRKRMLSGGRTADRWGPNGSFTYTSRPMTPTEREHFDRAFQKMNEAFAEFDKMGDV
jgi:hypothetical protein